MNDIVKWLAQKGIEDCKLTAYLCPAGKPTIGIGNTYYANGKPVRLGDKLSSLDEAYKLGELIVLDYCIHVKKLVTNPQTPNQFKALVSFCYNIGKAAFAKSVVLKMVNAGAAPDEIAKVMEHSFITAAGKPCKGVENRRLKEAKLFITV